MILHEILVLLGFLVMIAFFLTLDLGVFNKKDHEPGFKESLIYTILWVSLALIFWGLIYFYGNLIHEPDNLSDLKHLVSKFSHPIALTDNFEESLQIYRQNLGLEFLTGYIIEYSLSIDNVFIILMIFYSFGVKKIYYHKVLFWGIIGAVIMRFLFIFLSSELIRHFEWILYLFGLLLIYTGIKMFLDKNKVRKINTGRHPVIRLLSRYFPVDREYEGPRFILRKNGRLYLTGLLVVLMIIEFSDVIFAVDSVPAIFSVTKDPFIVYFSNIFAVIGLRSLFFVLMNIVERFRYLKIGLSVLLVFIGLKMMAPLFMNFHISTLSSLIIILAILMISILVSLVIPIKSEKEKH